MVKTFSDFMCVLKTQPWRHLRVSFEISSNAVAMETQCSPWNTVFPITPVNMLLTAQNVTCLITMRTSRHLSLIWSVIICSCHGDRLLANKHSAYVTDVSPKDIVRLARNFPNLATAESSRHLREAPTCGQQRSCTDHRTTAHRCSQL